MLKSERKDKTKKGHMRREGKICLYQKNKNFSKPP